MLACLRLPHFAAALEAHAHPELGAAPLALVDAAQDAHTVYAVSATAARAGVQVGMGLPQARARCADVQVRAAAPSRYRAALDNLLEALTIFTSHVEAEESPELRADGRHRRSIPFVQAAQLDEALAVTCYLDLGQLKAEEVVPLARQLHHFVGEQLPIPSTLGLASGKFPARVAAAAVQPGELLVVPPGQEAAFLAGFTVALLPVDGETLRQLDLLGVHTLGQLAALPSAALLDCFGQQGRVMHRLASGRDTSPVQPYAPRLSEQVACTCEPPIEDTGTLEAALGDLAAQAVERLRESGRTVRQVHLVVTLDDATVLEQGLALRQPTADPRHLAETLRDLAGALPLTRGVAAVEVLLSGMAPPVPRQLSLFDRPAVSQAHLNRMLHDLLAHYGSEHFYWLRPADREARLPERRFRWEKAGDR